MTSERARVWEVKAREELARSELESLALGWSFETQTTRIAGELREQLRTIVTAGFPLPVAEKRIREKAESLFRPPFPHHQLWVFGPVSSGTSRLSLILEPPKSSIGKVVVSSVYRHLVQMACNLPRRGTDDRMNEKLIRSLFGQGTNPDDLAGTQRGSLTPIIHQKRLYHLLWDTFGTRPESSYGFLLLVPDDFRAKQAGLVLALSSRPTDRRGLRSGFLRIFPDRVGDVIPRSIKDSKSFKRWRTSIESRRIDFFEREGLPWGVQLGRNMVYTQPIPSSTHLAITILPALPPWTQPRWLFLINLLIIVGFLFLLGRGFVFGIWPTINLGKQFAILFLLATLLPLSLAVLSGWLYIQESERVASHQLRKRLQTELKSHEARKERLQSDYIVAFQRLLVDPELVEILRTGDLQNPELLRRARGIFANRPESLPLSFFAFFDPNGGQIASFDLAISPDELATMIRLWRTAIIQNLRHRIVQWGGEKVLQPEMLSREEKIFTAAYENSTGKSMRAEVEQDRSRPVRFHIGRDDAWQMSDFVRVDGHERYACQIAWLDGSLDDRILKQIWEEKQGDPEIRFSAYRFKDGVPHLITPFDRHLVGDGRTMVQKAVAEVGRRRNPTIAQEEESIVLAFPSQRFKNVILVAEASLRGIQEDNQRATGLFILLGLLSLVTMTVFGFVTARRMVDPIRDMKVALDRVAAGHLDLRLRHERRDEIGTLMDAFTTMIGGLRERQRLTELVSGAALDVLGSSSTEMERRFSGQRLHGVVFLSDLRGFTTLCETHPAADMTSLLNRHFTETAVAIASWGGRIDKFIGDAVQAFFEESPPSPTSLELTPAERAICASLEVLRRVRSINQERCAEGLFPYRVGIGLAGGDLMGGGLGHLGTRFDYALIGPPVKRAAHLEALSKLHPDCPLVIDASLLPASGSFAALLAPLSGHDGEACIFPSEPTHVQFPSTALPEDNRTAPKASAHAETRCGQVPPGAIRPTGNSQRTWLPVMALYLLGLGLLFSPVFTIVETQRALRDRELKASVEEARTQNLDLLEKLQSPQADRIFLEERLERMDEELIAERGREEPEPLLDSFQGSGLAAMNRLRAEGVNPSRFFLMKRPFIPPGCDPKPEMWPLVIAEGCPASLTIGYQRLLSSLLAQATGDIQGAAPEVEASALLLTGKNVSLAYLGAAYKGRLIQTEIDGQPQWLFWEPLFLSAAGKGKAEIATGAGYFAASAIDERRPYGAVLLFLPRVTFSNRQLEFCTRIHGSLRDLQAPPENPILMSGTPVPTLALVAERPGRPIISSSGFPASLAAHLSFAEPIRDWPGYQITSEVIPGESAIRAFAVTTIPPSTTSSRIIQATWITFCLALLGAIFWTRTVFRGRAIAMSMSGQLLGGLLASSLIPLCGIFFLSERFVADHQESRFQEERHTLRMTFDDMERLEFLHRPAIWEKLRRWSHHPRVLSTIRKIFAPTTVEKVSSGNTITVQSPGYHEWLNILAQCFSRSVNALPHFPLDEVILVDYRGTHLGVNRQTITKRGPPLDGSFLQTAAMVDKTLLEDLRTSSSGDREEQIGNAFRGDLTRTIGNSILRATFGPEAYFRFNQAPGTPLILKGGEGETGLIQFLLPREGEPEFLIVWLFNYSAGANKAGKAILQAHQGRYAYFSLGRIFYGTLGEPQRGSFPFLRHLVRQTLSLNAPVSTSYTLEKGTVLAEARPGILNPNYPKAGLALVAPIIKEIASLRQNLLGLLFFGIGLTFLAALFAARDFLEPIRKLVDGMRRIKSGAFEHRLLVNREDEIGDVMDAFNRMAQGLQERELLGRMVSRDARKSTMEPQSASMGQPQPAPVEGRRECVVLSLGVADFDNLYKSYEPTSLFSLLTTVTKAICEDILLEGGDIDKVLGDKWLAYFSLPEGPEAEIQAALRAIYRLRRRETEGSLPLPLAVGINRGPVISGRLGAGNRYDFTIIGDTVNTAARTEAEAERLPAERYLLTPTVREFIPEDCPLHGEMALKGKHLPLKLYRLPIPPA